MSPYPGFRMVVDEIVDAQPHGVFVKGMVEGGDISKGDAVQVGVAPDAKTVRVGQISLGAEFSKLTPRPGEMTAQQKIDSIRNSRGRVWKALPQSEVTLLLLGLSPADIRVGDVLLSGQLERVARMSEAENVLAMPGRIAPLHRFGTMLGCLVILVALIIVLGLVSILMVVATIQGRGLTWGKLLLSLLAALGIIALLGYIALVRVSIIQEGFQARREFQAGSATTTARILRRFEVAHKDSYGTNYTYHMHVEFNPTLARKPIGMQQYSLAISKKLYDQLEQQEYVPLTYATGNPQIFEIEGE